MKNKILKNVLYIIIAVLVGVTVAYAGSLTPPGVPAKTMKSLSDLYQLVNTGANTPSTDFATPSTVSSTMYSLGDTYDLLKNKITAIDGTKIATGTSIFGVSGSATAGSSGGILKTGQSHCNAFSANYGSSSKILCANTNQDGESQRGLAKSYADKGDGTILDNNTGLTWQKCTAGQTGLDCSGGSATAMIMDNGNGSSPAINYCEGLALDGVGWHLPNVNELQSLVDYGRFSPAINPSFPFTQSGAYWSSTAYEDSTDGVWVVYFNDGLVYIGYMDGNSFVRCVRE